MASDSLDYWVSSSICSPVLFAGDGLEDGALDYWVSSSICSPEPVVAAGVPPALSIPRLAYHYYRLRRAA